MQTGTAQPTGRPHHNHGLFSDHYLDVTLPERPDWRALENEAASFRRGGEGKGASGETGPEGRTRAGLIKGKEK